MAQQLYSAQVMRKKRLLKSPWLPICRSSPHSWIFRIATRSCKLTFELLLVILSILSDIFSYVEGVFHGPSTGIKRHLLTGAGDLTLEMRDNSGGRAFVTLSRGLAQRHMDRLIKFEVCQFYSLIQFNDNTQIFRGIALSSARLRFSSTSTTAKWS
jgi:hypothetical protein